VRELRLDRIGQTANEHRQAKTDGDRVAVGIEQADGEVLGLINNRMIRRAHQIGLHLASDRDQSAADHFGGECIDLARRDIQNYRFHISQLTIKLLTLRNPSFP